MKTVRGPWTRLLAYALVAAVLIVVPAGTPSSLAGSDAQGKPFQDLNRRLQTVEAATVAMGLELAEAQRTIATLIEQQPAPATEAFWVKEGGFLNCKLLAGIGTDQLELQCVRGGLTLSVADLTEFQSPL
jgi:hypothetical protein